MPGPSQIFSELVTTTFRNHRKTLVDNVSRHNALLTWLKAEGKMEKESGGLEIAIPLEYAENSTYQRYSGFDVLNTSQSDVFTTVVFPWRQIALNVVASGRELRINSGKSQIIKLSKARLTNAMHTFNNNFSFDLYSDGTLTNQIGGLQSIVTDLGTGTVGGIDSAAWPFWQNKVQSAAAPMQGGGAITVGTGTMEELMLPLYLSLTRGNDKPNLILTSNDYFALYERSLSPNRRYTGDEKVGKSGFDSLKYKGAEVVYDGNSGIPNSRMYFLNTKYWGMTVHSDADLTTSEEAKPFNQDGVVIPMLWMGNSWCSNRALQGVLKP